MPVTAQLPSSIVPIGAGEILAGAAVSCAGMLRAGETITGTPTAVVTPSNAPDATPTATSLAANAAAITVLDETVAIGEAIQFTLTGNSAAKKTYTITFTWTTSNGSTMQGAVNFKII